MLIDPEKTPRHNQGLRKLSFDLPRLSPDIAATCPVSFEDVRQYVEVESASFDSSSLKWVRTANIDDVHYWIWEMDDLGDLTYVYVEDYDGTRTTCLNSADGLTLEQFIVKEYLANQFDWKKPFEDRMAERRDPKD